MKRVKAMSGQLLTELLCTFTVVALKVVDDFKEIDDAQPFVFWLPLSCSCLSKWAPCTTVQGIWNHKLHPSQGFGIPKREIKNARM
jgi:hypothetical protein